MLTGVNLADFHELTKTPIHQIAIATGISYSTLHKHWKHGHRITQATAERLAEFDPRLTVADILGITEAAKTPSTPKARRKRKAA